LTWRAEGHALALQWQWHMEVEDDQG